jgi:serine/threonine protein kinase
VKQVTFGNYILLHRLARGGMADLFLARDIRAAQPQAAEPVVIKLVSSNYAEDPSFLALFEDEVRIAASLDHSNIGRVTDVGQVSGQYYLAMEFLHGKDLRDITVQCRKQGYTVPPAITVAMAIRICAALQYAHQAQTTDGSPLHIVHRDVSPSNIMLTFGGQVKLLDFGIAKAVGRVAKTQPGTIRGKVRYLSPEQVEGKPIDRRSDLFTLGISLWEATVGYHLFSGSKPVEIYYTIVKNEIRRPSSVIPDYPPELERILLKALAQDVKKRYATAHLLQLDLEAYAKTAGFNCSDAALASFIQQLFGKDFQAWEQAHSRGTSMLEYLQMVALELGTHENDLDDVLASGDRMITRPDSRPAEPKRTETPSPKEPPERKEMPSPKEARAKTVLGRRRARPCSTAWIRCPTSRRTRNRARPKASIRSLTRQEWSLLPRAMC